jgi:hypothetical protein
VCIDENLTYLGSEAGTLITALEAFISDVVVRSQSRVRNTIINVDLGTGTRW